MRQHGLTWIFCMLYMASSASADIVVWQGNAANCTINDFLNRIEINAAGTYGFRGQRSGALAEIQSIIVPSTIAGAVSVRIAYDAGGGDGATAVWVIDLTNASPGTLTGVEVQGDLGTTGSIDVDEIVAWQYTWGVDVGGDLLNPIVAPWCDSSVRIGGDCAGLNLGVQVLSGNIEIAGNLLGDLYAKGAGYVYIDGAGQHTGNITLPSFSFGTLRTGGSLTGDVWIGSGQGFFGTVDIGGDYAGTMEVSNWDLKPGGELRIRGDSLGDFIIEANLGGEIRIDGSLTDAVAGDEVTIVGQIESTGAVTVDYDGWDAADTWESGATVKEGTSTVYTGNTPAAHVWEVSSCKGDMNNDWITDSSDSTPFSTALSSSTTYAANFPGLLGSMEWHGDTDSSGVFDSNDQTSFDHLASIDCCVTDWEHCPEDINRDGVINITDLGILLAVFGLCQGDPGYDPRADIVVTGCIDISDLGALLAVFGNTCACGTGQSAAPGGGGSGSTAAALWVSLEPIDMGGLTAGGFAGEDTHFVFDLVVEVEAADWTTSAVVARAIGGAAFRVSGGPTEPDALSSFVCVPRETTAPVADELGATGARRTVIVAGGYAPLGPLCDFDTGLINVVWCDAVESADGPARVMRLVLDVSCVAGADTAAGLGSVYFSQSGPDSAGDIKVADMEWRTTVRPTAAGELDGAFYVTTE